MILDQENIFFKPNGHFAWRQLMLCDSRPRRYLTGRQTVQQTMPEQEILRQGSRRCQTNRSCDRAAKAARPRDPTTGRQTVLDQEGFSTGGQTKQGPKRRTKTGPGFFCCPVPPLPPSGAEDVWCLSSGTQIKFSPSPLPAFVGNAILLVLTDGKRAWMLASLVASGV